MADYNKTQLKAIGFSDRLIKMLPEPLKIKNQHGRFMYLWSLETVLDFMEREDFKKYQAQRQRRSSAAKKCAEKKTKENVERIRKTTTIKIKKRDCDFKDFLLMAKSMSDAGMKWMNKVVMSLAAQIWMNDVEIDAESLEGQTGRKEMKEALREMTAEKLSDTYPFLSDFFAEIVRDPDRYIPFYF